MIRWLRILFLLVLAVCLLTVALANREPVMVQLMSAELGALVGFNYAIELPLFIVIYGGIVAGLLIGFVIEWFREHKHRAAVRARTKEVKTLQREVTSLRANVKQPPKDDVLAILTQKAS